MKAGNNIHLKPGFTASNGSNFTAKIGAITNTAKRFYYLKDHLGSIRVTVNEAGEIVSHDDYDPWGMQLAGRSGNEGFANDKYKFTSKERDTETGYDYFGARYYDSRIGRWLQVDPRTHKSFDLSPYNYCQNNPFSRIDPDGGEDWWAFIKASVVGGLSIYATYSGFMGMVAAGGSEVVTGGTSTPASIPAFLGSMALFNLGIVGIAESIINVKLALETPTGMTAEQYSIVKEVVKGFGGSGVTQEGVALIINAIGLKGVSKFDESTLEALQVLVAGGSTSESIVNFIREAASKQTSNQVEQSKTPENENKEKNKKEKEDKENYEN